MIKSYIRNKSFLLPTALVALFIIFFSILLQTGDIKYYNLSRMLIQWDGQHYLSIADEGYQKFPCGWDANYICGNIGWFPALPLLSRLIGAVGVPANWALIITSWLFFWGGCLLLFALIRHRYHYKTALLTLLALFLFPGAFYFLTAYPNALYFFLIVWLFFLRDHNRHYLLWLPASLLAVTHPSGAVAALPLIVMTVYYWRKEEYSNRNWSIIALAAMLLSLGLYFSYYWYRFDDFLLYLHHQSQPYYAHRMTFPLLPIGRLFMHPSVDWYDFTMLAFVIGTTVLFYRRNVKISWQVFMFALLLFSPTMGTTDSYFRYVQAAFPLYLMVALASQGKYGKLLFAVYAVASITLMWTVFLPGYKLGLLR